MNRQQSLVKNQLTKQFCLENYLPICYKIKI